MATVNETNVRETIAKFYEALSRRDISMLAAVVTDDWEYIPEPIGAARGPSKMVAVFDDIASALPDMEIEILDILTHENRVGVRAVITGTQHGPILGIEATSKDIRFSIHSFHELRDQRIAKTWHLEDWLSVFQQLGRLPPLTSSWQPHHSLPTDVTL